MSLYEEREAIQRCIDHYEWKHSWHLPKDQYGHTNWYDQETMAKCKQVLMGYSCGAAAFAAECGRLVAVIQEEEKRRKDSA